MADARVPRPASIRIEGGGAYVARDLVFVAGSGVTFGTELIDFLVYSHGQGVMSTVELSHATTAVQPT